MKVKVEYGEIIKALGKWQDNNELTTLIELEATPVSEKGCEHKNYTVGALHLARCSDCRKLLGSPSLPEELPQREFADAGDIPELYLKLQEVIRFIRANHKMK